MKEFKIQYLLAEQLDDFRKNILYSDQSLKYCKKFNKEKNGGIYKSFCLFSFIYILLLQTKAFYQNNLSAVGMLFLTTFFLIYILLPSYNLLDVSSVALRLKFSLSRFVPDIFTFFYLLLIYIFQNTGKYSLLEEK